MSLINNGKLLIEQDKALMKKNIRVSVVYGIPSLVVAVISAYLTFRGFGFLSAIICIMAFVLFGFCVYGAVMNFKNLKSGKPMLEADSGGIHGGSVLMLGFVPWNNVKKIYMKPMSLNGKILEYIEIELFDKDGYINSLSSGDRKTVRLNMSMGHEAASLLVTLLKIDTDELLNDLIYLWERNR